MAGMTPLERLTVATSKKRADKLPFAHWWQFSQTGRAERECRNRGMGFIWHRPPYVEKMHGVDVTEAGAVSSGESVVRYTYTTPVGSVYYDEIRGPGTGQYIGQQSWKGVVPWQTERLIQRPEDYKVVKYMVENTEYVPDYFPIEQAMDWLGEDGVAVASLNKHSPMQMLMIDWIGSDGGRFFYHHVDYPDLVEGLYRAISKSREPLYEIAAKSPAPVVLCGDNVDGFLVSPNLFEKYFMPEYEKQAKVLHEHGKLMAVHMDGRVGSLKHLIARTPIDIVEAFHPPPMGDITLSEALALWPDKVIWLGYPGGVYELGPQAIREHALALLREAGKGDRLVVEMNTETQVSNDNLLALTSVLENATLPLTQESIDRIEKATA